MTRADIAHYHGLEVWCPVTADEVLALLEPLDVCANVDVLDVGCGQAEILLRCAERWHARITGVDISEAALDLARAASEGRVPPGRATWRTCDLDTLTFPDASFDVIVAIGGPYREGSLATTLDLYARWLRAGGHLVLGDGFWATPPPAPYLAALDLPWHALLDRDAHLALTEAYGFVRMDTCLAAREGWDRFEQTIQANHEAYARQHADDPDVQALIARKRAWHEAQERWGRKVMGFAVDVLRKRPGPPVQPDTVG